MGGHTGTVVKDSKLGKIHQQLDGMVQEQQFVVFEGLRMRAEANEYREKEEEACRKSFLDHLEQGSDAGSHYDDYAATELNSASESKKTDGRNVENGGANISMTSKLNTQETKPKYTHETKAKYISNAISKVKQQ